MPGITPFQTVGPFLSLGLRAGRRVMQSDTGHASIVVTGRLLDGMGAGIPDGALEFWHPAFTSIGRVLTDADGWFRLETTKPPPLAGAQGAVMAPHFAMRVLGRGILTQYVTRVYFDDEPATARDPVVALVPPDRRSTLIARLMEPHTYRFDVVIQGDRETVFFDL